VKTDLKTNLRAIWGRAYVRIVGANREPSWIIFETLMPLLATLTYVYVYKALKAPEDYTGFVVLGGAMTAFWLNVLWSMASQFYWEKQGGNLDLYLVAPISRMAILLGMAIGGFFMTFSRAAAVVIGGVILFHVSFTVQSYWKLFLVFGLSLVALYGLGMLFSSLFLLFGREAWHMVTMFQEPVYLASGFYFPVRALGFYVALAASIVPVTLGMDAMRQLLFPTGRVQGLLPVNLEILLLSGLSVLFLFLAQRALGYMEKLGKREGRLTLRWE
jgi:ABC-2 type transport system permease protein